MYRVRQLTVLDKKTQKPLAKPKRNREVQDIEVYRQLEQKRYERLLDVEVEIHILYTECPERSEQ